MAAASSTYELVDVDVNDEGKSQPPTFEDGASSQGSWIIDEKRTSRLPPRPLKHGRPLWPFGIAFVSTFAIFFAFLFLLKNLARLKPHGTSTYPAYTSILNDDNSTSCDLVHKDGSAMQNAFLIDLRSSLELSFLEAKVIDVIWDLVVGQGGRCLMAWISYRVFMDSLVALMEKAAVTYDMYTSIAFSTTSLWALWESLKALFRLKGIRAKLFMLWFALAVTYVLAFPTLMGAATGYVNPSTTSYNMGNGTWAPVDTLKLFHCANVTKGSLIGLKDGEIVNGPPLTSDESFRYEQLHYNKKMTSDFNRTYSDFLALLYPSNNTGNYYEVTDVRTKDVFNATVSQLQEKYMINDSDEYGFDGFDRFDAGVTVCSNGHYFCGAGKPCQQFPQYSSSVASDCNSTYSGSYVSFNSSVYPIAEISNTWYSNITFKNHNYTTTNYSVYIQSYSTGTYSTGTYSTGTYSTGPTDVTTESICTSNGDPLPNSAKDKPQCIPKPYFVWGFSSLLLYIILPLQMIWTLGMFLVWLHAHMTSELLLAQRTVHGPLRAAADLTEAMKEVLGDEFCNYQDGELQRELKSEGGNLRFYAKDGEEDEVGHIGISSREDRALALKRTKLYGGLLGSVRRRKL